MILRLYFRDELLGEARLMPDGSIECSGPQIDAVRHKIDYYSRHSGFAGEELLRHIEGRMSGWNHAEIVEDAPTTIEPQHTAERGE